MNTDETLLYKMRHSQAHILANAVQHLWPEAKFGVGPVIENGFYYDIDLGTTKLSDEDFAAIESEMEKIIDADEPFELMEMTIDEAIAWSKENEQPYKLELLNDLKRAGTTNAGKIASEELGLEATDGSKIEKVTFYRNGDFTDLCRGPHVESTSKVGPFKLMRVSGAYWRGDERKPQMQRIYGICFETKQELDDHLKMLEEAKQRDHRKLGTELDLFLFSDLVGSGLPLFTPRGTIMREALAEFTAQLRQEYGFQKVWVPHLTKKELYEVSGHWAKFGDELFLVRSQETSDQLVLKPMNCPHHTRIYASRPRSYRDLPIRYMETTTVFRDEKTGELGGLNRVRSITQDDSHVFCRADQVRTEMNNLLIAASRLYSTLEMDLRVRLSYRDDSEAYLGDRKLWGEMQKQLKEAVEANDLSFFEQEGEAAFYGPKIDFMVTDALGREHQVATVQLDFVMPERFGLEYTGEDGLIHSPVMIHCALLGSIERFLAVYIEHTAGKFPVWLSPEQVRLITVNQDDAVVKFAHNVANKATEIGVRLTIDDSNESVGKKIRAAEIMKIPYVVVIGEKEINGGELNLRIRKDLEVEASGRTYNTEELLKSVANETKTRTSRSTL